MNSSSCFQLRCPTKRECHKCEMSKTFLGDAICREFKSEAPAAEEMLDRIVCSCKQFSFQTCLESGDGSGTFSKYPHLTIS